jgi:S1-C subfamily serine protease
MIMTAQTLNSRQQLINRLFFFLFLFILILPKKTQAQLTIEEQNTINIFKQSSPLVVSVSSTQIRADFFSLRRHEIPAGTGTGFIWDRKGHIITNYHVIQAALSPSAKVSITTKDGKQYQAQVVGTEIRQDIAVLKVDGFKLNGNIPFSEKLADSKNLLVGQKVLAIGNPFGFEQSLSQGIISALDRSMPSLLRSITIRNMVQTDASINPGNSGGPLIDSRGQLIGMNTAIVSGSGSSAGIGFAVPANTIKRIASQIIEHGRVIQPGIGVTILDAGEQMALAHYGYPVKKGVVIRDVTPNTPAAQAGLRGIFQGRRDVRIGDIIIGIDKQDVDDYDDLYNILSEKKVGDRIELRWSRQGKIMSKKIKLTAISSD